jgi:hypothetical protein
MLRFETWPPEEGKVDFIEEVEEKMIGNGEPSDERLPEIGHFCGSLLKANGCSYGEALDISLKASERFLAHLDDVDKDLVFATGVIKGCFDTN